MSQYNSHYADMSSYPPYDPSNVPPPQQYPPYADQTGGNGGYDQSAYGQMNYDQYYTNADMMPPATGEMQTNMMNHNNTNADYYDGSDPYANEPPLLEELEINLGQITQKTWAVLTFKSLKDSKNILQDPDLAGPLVFLLLFGFLLLLTGKIQFGFIYGLGTLGCLIIYFIVYIVSPKGISFLCTVSVLGYCLLPMVMLSALSILINLKALAGNILSVVAIVWCAIGASNLLVTAVDVTNSRLVIAYPCALFYTVFALLTVF